MSGGSGADLRVTPNQRFVPSAQEITGVQVYPNPARQQVYIAGPDHYEVTLFDSETYLSENVRLPSTLSSPRKKATSYSEEKLRFYSRIVTIENLLGFSR